jgi:hypothetical protein
MAHSVLGLSFDLPTRQAVIKISQVRTFEREARGVTYLKTHSKLPVPQVYLCKG